VGVYLGSAPGRAEAEAFIRELRGRR